MKRTRVWLWSIAACGGIATACALSALWWPYDLQVVTDQQSPGTREATGPGQTSTPDDPPLSAFQPLLARDLRPPLFDSPVAAPAPQALPVRLTGLIIEPGRSLAVLQKANGQTELKGPGERSGEVEVLTVGPDSVEVRFGGAVHRLSVEKDQKG